MLQKIRNIVNKAQKKRAATLSKLNKKTPHFWLATWFGSGLIVPMPGTWGTLFSLPFAALVYFYGDLLGLLVAIILTFLIGIWAARRYEEESGEHDNSMIVIDETAGLLVTVLACTGTWLSFLLAFVLFRFFDIIKPWPIKWLDKKVDGAFGVMIDDIVAGMFAAITLWGIHAYIIG